MKRNSPTVSFGNKASSHRCRQLFFLAFCLLPSAFCLSSCGHPPETAAELQARLPAQYQGELHLQGETETHRIVLEAHDLKERDAHRLEFGKVRYQFYTGNALTTEGEADIRGTISTPDLAVNIESFGGEAGGDALKPGTFEGKLGRDLKTMEASWTTGYGQKISLQAKAQP